ncbi:triple gene block protein 3 [Panax ginseng flexivirus 1]|uniref:triple gene block protein 3 n=1 Tax=Panax ginseng flexivirus 1 TaxID=2303411 RepID=UPI000E3329BA|nr:triple gene block protein 3 [Panax ginseng flexivirus 1]AXN92355.1 triple gene block protein 3 [Panax ginseng flexivirus 1]
MLQKDLLLGLLGAALVYLALVLVDNFKESGCSIRLTGESVSVINCQDLEAVAKLIRNSKPLWLSLGGRGDFEIIEERC